MWSELERVSGCSLLHECGLLHFGPEGAPNLVEAMDGLKALGIAHRQFTPRQVFEVFPQLRMASHEIGIFTPDGGWVDANAAVLATADLVERAGGRILESSKIEREELERRFDRFVVAAGSWVRDFVQVPVTVTVQTIGYIATPPIEGPVWIHESPELFYGFPSEPGRFEVKIGVHRDGRVANPDASEREPSPIDEMAIAGEAARLLQLHGAAVKAETCLYTNTVNEDFLFGRLGDKGFFASACSGHGFKFGPWSGQLLADFVDENLTPEDYPRFLFPATT